MSTLTHISPRASIGLNVQIEAFVTIGEDVTIGDNCWIGSNVTIMPGARIGKRCKIFPGAVIAAIPQDLKFNNEETKVIIGDFTTIRECVTINRGTSASGKTLVGDNCLLMAYSHVAHDCHLGNNCVTANAVQIGGHVEIGDWVVVGGSSVIHQYSKIGKHSFISGASAVIKDIPPYITAGRNPISFLGLNIVGLRRRGFNSSDIKKIKSFYNKIYLSKDPVLTQINQGSYDYNDSDVLISDIVAFIKSSERGIVGNKIQL